MQLLVLSILFLKALAYDGYFSLSENSLVSHDFKENSSNSLINSDQCDLELHLIKEAIDRKEQWAVKLVDTWAKVNAGYLKGNQLFFGDYDSCLQFQHSYESGKILKGQYCLVTLSAHANSTLSDGKNDLSLKNVANFFRNNKITVTNGFCMPASCTGNEVVEFLNENFLLKNDLIAFRGNCRDIDAIKFGAIEYFAISILSIFGITMILSTTYDIIISKSKNPKPNKLLTSFSIYTNGSKLFDVTKIKSPSSINCLHGLRGMSILWIIFGHRFFNQIPYGNPADVKNLYDNNVFMGTILKAYPIAVDTFFVMGAVLMTWTTLRDLEKKQLNIFRMIWRRYIRYTPVYAAMILIAVSFTEILSQGPIYNPGIKRPCVKNWYLALLHVQNYIPLEEMCLNHGWYLSADFQLFVISPFIIWFIHKYGKKMLAIPATLCIGTIIYIFTISMIHNIEMVALTVEPNFLKYIYSPTYSRAGPWFIGMILGYFLYSYRGQQFKINKILNAFIWIATISLLGAILLIHFAISVAKDPLPQAYHSTYMALQRNLWAVGICSIIFSCQHLKTGGIIRWFLSLSQWQPISRMGLSMYLVGFIYQIIAMTNQRVPLYMNIWSAFPLYISDIVIIATLGTFLYLAFEAPPLIIEDYVYKKFKTKAT